MVNSDHKAGCMLAHRLILDDGQADELLAGWIAALAHKKVRARVAREAFVRVQNPLVTISQRGLIANLCLDPIHRRASTQTRERRQPTHPARTTHLQAHGSQSVPAFDDHPTGQGSKPDIHNDPHEPPTAECWGYPTKDTTVVRAPWESSETYPSFDAPTWNDGVAVHFGLCRPAAAAGTDPVALWDAELAGDEAGDTQSAVDEFAADVVDTAQPLS